VILTGTDNDIVGLRAIQMGAQDYLVKGSFNARTLARCVRYAIARADRGRGRIFASG
jgi:DNA-binding response OmpR family regulator